jgi:hypothetical protein
LTSMPGIHALATDADDLRTYRKLRRKNPIAA